MDYLKSILAVTVIVSSYLMAEDAKPLTDSEFANKIAVGGDFEVKAGNLAQQKASSADIKTFGSQMVRDHGKANSELSALAKSKNWTLPNSLDDKHQKKLDRLNQLSGEAFDREYTDIMVKGHRETAETFRASMQNATDADFKSWSRETLTVVEAHLKHAETLSNRSGNPISNEQKVKASYEDQRRAPQAGQDANQDNDKRRSDRTNQEGVNKTNQQNAESSKSNIGTEKNEKRGQ